jgi:NADPH-dependent glutamate synthase beta subunit-like oxidoreductase/Pyruvate/2-oxoacid:ferredoxin oxidoreductase delta subunit
MAQSEHTFRKFKDGDSKYRSYGENIFEQDTTYKCPTYVHRTPPCQGSCPSGEDIRGWLSIVRGIEKPPAGMDKFEYAFKRSTTANPFPSIMGRVCPAPCQEGCNRNEVEDFVGINSVEQFIGDNAREKGYTFGETPAESGYKVAIIGGGPGGLACAYQLRKKGHAVTLIDNHKHLGGMMRYGIPGYRTPRDVLDHEIDRILNLGVEVKLNTFLGKDVTLDQLRADYDAVVIAIGAQSGNAIPIPGGDADNCITGVSFLDAYNDGRLRFVSKRVVVIGGGDTAMDVVSVARRLGHITSTHENDRPENVILNQTAQDVALTANKEGAQVILAYRRPVDKMPAALHEVEAAEREGVELRGSLVPVSVVLDENNRATALRVAKADWSSGKMVIIENSEHDIECDLIVSAIGQGGDLTGMENFNNGRGLINSDKYFQVPGEKGLFVIGDIVKPHLLTTAIGHASIAAESIDYYLNNAEYSKRPKVDVHHFDLIDKLRETNLAPGEYAHQAVWGTNSGDFAVHNYEDRSAQEIITADRLFLGHFPHQKRNLRPESHIEAKDVIDSYEERFKGFESAEKAEKEADRCMSCGMCFECDNCVIYCPQDAVFRVKKDKASLGRYVDTDYTRCIGCHICSDVCPTGYIDMALGDH